MRSCVNARCCEHRLECDPMACDDYVPLPTFSRSLTILAVILVVMTCCVMADAVTLNISGHSSGQGVQMLNFSGDNLSAVWNGTAWNITAVVN